MSKEMSLNEKLEKLMDRFEEMDEKINFGSEFKTEYDVNWYTDIREALNRLEAIDNANPSEALKYLDKIKTRFRDTCLGMYLEDTKEFTTIKQALLKAQEPKQYLKWEDLEFKIENQEMFVLLNGSCYLLEYYNDSEEDFVFIKAIHTTVFELLGERSDDKQFFNDLHLERVEE